MAVPGLIVFSHLRWDHVYQRPQHLMSVLSRRQRIWFIEEAVFTKGAEAFWEKAEVLPGVSVLRPHVPERSRAFDARQLPFLRRLVESLPAEEGIDEYVVWFYTPMALPLLSALDPQAVVYDCMDELSAFLKAPPEMAEREAELLGRADLVFTGGPSLYRAKKDLHPHVHCFPSSVDARHFAQARPQPGVEQFEAEDQRDLPHPRLGYFGVIDERIDLRLLDLLARSRPDWQIAMVGPVAKIDPSDLPQAPNLHYFGKRPYEDLPRYLAGWDVCLLPFALNEATRWISPTKTLEYMAAERPIVSTPITDVAEPYGEIVYLAKTPEEFVAACEAALAADSAERGQRVAKMRGVLAGTSWKATAQAMGSLIDQAVTARGGSVPTVPPAWESPAVDSRPDPQGTPPVVVIGAGPTGLSAAYHLGEEALLIERNDQVGGWCRSLELNGFTFDWAGHIMFSNDPYVHELYELLLGDNVHWQDREAWIYSKRVFTRYPFQGSLYGLPPEVIKECVVGAIEARYGSVKGKGAASTATRSHDGGNGSNGHAPGSNGQRDGNGHAACDSLEDCCADGVLESTAPLGAQDGASSPGGQPGNFEEFIYQVWGAGIAKHFAIPYNRKLWAVDLKEMETSWLGGRVPMPDLEEMIEGSLKPSPKPMGPNARFGYPLRGGFQALMDGFLPLLRGPRWMNSAVTAVSPTRHTVDLADGRVVPYERLISTMPLPVLIRQIGDEAPREVQQAAAALRFVSVRCVHLGVGRERLTEKHWIYYPEDTVFHRIFVQGNASPHCNPPGGFGLTCEITYSPHKPLPCEGDDLVQLCIEDCRRVGMIAPDDPIWAATQVDMPHAYVVYDHARPRNVALIRQWLEERDILLAGRYSEWEYYNSDHAFLAGKKAAERARQGRAALAGSATR